MQTSSSITELAKALSRAQGQIQGAAKDTKSDFFRSMYADLDSVWDAIRKPLADNGLSVIQFPGIASEKGSVLIETRVLHSSGEWIESTFSVPVSKQDAQGYGSAVTYGRRYSLMAAIGVAPTDDDGNAAVGKSQQKTEEPRQREDGMISDASLKSLLSEIGCKTVKDVRGVIAVASHDVLNSPQEIATRQDEALSALKMALESSSAADLLQRGRARMTDKAVAS